MAQVGESKRGSSWAELGWCWSCAAPPPSAPHLRLPLLVHPVDLAPHKHTDPALAPSLLAAEKIGDEEGEAWHQGGTALRIDRAPYGFPPRSAAGTPFPVCGPQFTHLCKEGARLNQAHEGLWAGVHVACVMF